MQRASRISHAGAVHTAGTIRAVRLFSAKAAPQSLLQQQQQRNLHRLIPRSSRVPVAAAKTSIASNVRHMSNTTVSINTPPSSGPRKSGLGWKIAGGIIFFLGAGALVAGSDEGTRRSLRFWRGVLPIWIEYRRVQTTTDISEEEREARYNALHDMYAGPVERLMLELKGMYLKNAQLLSTRDEFVPPQYMEICKRVQDQVPTDFAPQLVHAVIERSLNKKMEDVFMEFDDKPLGAASIGQAHLARLRDGTQVVVKVMYPDIEKQFRSDLKTQMFFCELAMPQHVTALKEIERQFLTEFDYVGEAENMQLIHDNIMPVFGKEVLIPKPFKHLCTKEVLVMEYVPGVRLVDGIRACYKEMAESMGTTLEELEAAEKQAVKEGRKKKRSLEEEHAKTMVINTLVMFRDIAVNTLVYLYNSTVALVTRHELEYQHTKPLIDLGYILDLLLRVHAHEMFMNGAFNGDPHPGNVLLCPDGRLGLIDYGQVKRVDLETRLQYARLICAVAHDNANKALEVYKQIGHRSKFNNREIQWQLARFWNDCDDESVIGSRNIHTFLEWAHEVDPVIVVPQEYVMFARVSVLLRGVANAFGLRVRTAKHWEPTARKLLQQHGITDA